MADELTREQLLERAGVSVQFLDRLVDLNILTPADTEPQFSNGDLRRARFLHGLDEGGLPLEAVSAAIRSGHLSFAFFDYPFWQRFGGLVAKTLRELSDETGLSLEMLQVIRESMGFARPQPEDLVREDELDQVALIKMGLAVGADPVALERQTRVWGESVRRIAEADANFYHTQFEIPLLKAGMSESQMMEMGSQSSQMMAPLLDQALISMYHAQSEHTWMANVVEAVEATLEREGLHRSVPQPPAICFLDLTGYTRLTEERGDDAAARTAATLTQLVHRMTHSHGGRPVKWLGDGVMILFTDPAQAVRSSLEMVEGAPAAGLPPAHVGIDAGPVILQDGDYFGRTVNTAARIAARASAGQVLVSDEVAQATNDPNMKFFEIGSVELKGISRPIRIHEAQRDDPGL
jgi:adenylate cyclase